MDEVQENGEYKANDADTLVAELFSGGISVGEAIEKLRTRLLDLSARNRLLNYRFPKRRCIQIIDKPSINLVFDRLYIGGKAVPLRYVPEPPLYVYEGKRPEARQYAPQIDIDVSYDFPPNPASSNGHRLHGIQTLFYPTDLERQLRKIAVEAKTAIEETGSNILFLVFGFLEFYDSEDSERPMLAPLLSLPVTLERGKIDPETRTYQYAVQHNGEDLAENHTLREKLRMDFQLSMPEFEEEDEPERYFSRLEQAIRTRRRWRIRRQITLGMLSFGKLAIWADLDTHKNPGLPAHELVKSVFSGGTDNGAGNLHAPDYKIDERPEAAQSLIYDADSSQHSAIIDVLSGKNLVINGPPGTGKSQTITNIIAAALSSGKKVLFVSEKLAALEVVRHRLNQAGLGHFCLELHSHKTQKKRFLEDINARIEQDFPAPHQFEAKLSILQRQKEELARYAQLMGSRVGNHLGLTINELFWAAERRRQELGDLAAKANDVSFPDAARWTHDDLERRRSRLAGLAEVYDGIGSCGPSQPWWGFRPSPLAPSDDEAIAKIVRKALDHARDADGAAREAVTWFGLQEPPDASSAATVTAALQSVPPVPREFLARLLDKLFDQDIDPRGQRSSRLIADVASGVAKSRSLLSSAAEALADGCRLSEEELAEARSVCERRQLASTLLSADIGAAMETVSDLERAAESFEAAARAAAPQYAALARTALSEFSRAFDDGFVSGMAPYSARALSERSSAVLGTMGRLCSALSAIQAVATRWGLPFDGTPNSVARLADPDSFEMLSRDLSVDEPLLAEARRLAASALADRPLDEICSLRDRLQRHAAEWNEAVSRCRAAAERAGLGFDSSRAAIAELSALAQVAAAAPHDLLEYRNPSFNRPRTAELIGRAREALAMERESRERFGRILYLDALPSAAEIKRAATTLRSKDGLLAFLDADWRRARRLHATLCRQKRKLGAKARGEELASLAAWMDARDAFLSDHEYQTAFGELFRGLETDPDMIARLHTWYQESKARMVCCPGLSEKVNLTSIGTDRLAELALQTSRLDADSKSLSEAESNLRGILGSDLAGFHEALYRGWDDAMAVLEESIQNMGALIAFFEPRVASTLSPREAVRLMAAKSALSGVASELELLIVGEKAVRSAGSDELGNLASLAGGTWEEALREITERASKVQALVAQARSIAREEAPLAVALCFAKAKLALDSAWERVALPAAWNRFRDWNSLADAARQDAAAARGILEKFSTVAKSGVSAARVFSAAVEEEEARSILARFTESSDVRRVIGDLFSGLETDLVALAATHAWGSAVCILNLPPAVKRSLLSENAGEALEVAKRLYRRIAEGCREARSVMEELSAFGTFSWEDWQAPTRAHPGRYYPGEILARMAAPAANPASVLPWSKYLSLRRLADEEGLGDFVTALETQAIPSHALAAAFEFAAYHSIGRSVYRMFPELSRFNGGAHEKTRDAYRALDSEIIALTGSNFASQIVRNAHIPEGQRGTTVGEYTELQLLYREINKKKRHIPIRQLMKRAGEALLELKPCFMMGPLSVAQYIEQGALKFDLVVMDEASQLRPEDALGAVARGTQLVVVGDPKQLPPTSFFDRLLDTGDDEEEDEAPAALTGMESILDICQQLFTPVRSLRWHYRSHHESLIAFSNHYFYRNLIVFPSPYSRNPGLGVKYRYVRGGTYRDRQNVPEAQRLVDAVLEHMLKRPDESLGVVTLNQTQRELIEELLDRKLKTFREGAEFLSRWEAEGWPFFVKNLENVQGDERDVIFISTTYGKASGTDRVRQNFGPISRPDGWRRLNVLFTRSKRRVELFTSMSPEDIIVDEKTPMGTKALRNYLDFAKRGLLVATDEGEREPDSDFEVSVANVVTALGFEVKPQLGVAGFFIDMAVRNPDRPGEFLAGIECDGATYHSGASVRDRDRIRQEILESLGWKGKIYRIWSTDWFYNPGSEIQRLRAFLEQRRRLSALENPEDIEMEDSFEAEDSLEDPAIATQQDANEQAEELAATIAAGSGAGDLFVEVGDEVTYFPVDNPTDRRSILIVDSESDFDMGLVNENAPLAQALLGLSPGDEGALEGRGIKGRRLRVTRVQRRGQLQVESDSIGV